MVSLSAHEQSVAQHGPIRSRPALCHDLTAGKFLICPLGWPFRKCRSTFIGCTGQQPGQQAEGQEDLGAHSDALCGCPGATRRPG